MKGGKRARGFTIVETLIVLAVTGGLFVAVAITLSGRQQRTQFTQSIQEIKSQVEQVINDVAVGYYPNPNNFTCTPSLSGPVFGGSSTAQGENTGCIFIGKAIQFDVNATSNPELINIFTIAGLQRDTEGDEVTTYVDARPAVVPNATERKKLLYGLNAGGMDYAGSTSLAGVVAFVNSLASYSGASIVSGAHQVLLLPIKGGNLGQSESTTATAISNYLRGVGGYTPDADVSPTTGVRICFVSGGTDQSGLMVIGSTGRELSVTVSIKANKTCS